MKILELDKFDKKKYIAETDDYIIAKGGDGTILKAISKYKHLNKPFFGVAAGTANFLMNQEDTPTENAKYKKLKLIKIDVTYNSTPSELPEYITESYQAFNDIMIGGDMNSWINFEVNEKDEFFGEFKGGGLIFSTPQGSTGINKNNNGSILPLASDLWTITGDKTDRKIDYVIKPRATSVKVNSRTPVNVWVDGSNNIIKNVSEVELYDGDSVVVIFNDYNLFKRKRRL